MRMFYYSTAWRPWKLAMLVMAALLCARGQAMVASDGQLTPSAWDIPENYRPELLLSRHSGPVPPDSTQSLQFHWVITTCPSKRQHWGRFITTTLLSALVNDLRPASINIVLCQQYNTTEELPALLYNMRFSHTVNVFLPSKTYPITETGERGIKQMFWRTTLTALLVPAMLNATDIPLFMTEDDVLFVPDAHPRLSKAVEEIRKQAGNEPYHLSVYNHGNHQFPVTAYTTDLPQQGVLSDQEVHTRIAEELRHEIPWGFQGVLMAPGMYKEFVELFRNLSQQVKNPSQWFGHSDERVKWHMWRMKCNQPGSGCHAYVATPSIVQHIGTTSAAFQTGKGNPLFHFDKNFIARVKFPGWEDGVLWRRFMRRRSV